VVRRSFLLAIFAAILLAAVGSDPPLAAGEHSASAASTTAPRTAANAPPAQTQSLITPKRADANAVDLSKLCSHGNCDAAFASLRPGTSYYLPVGVWTFTKPFTIRSNVTLTGDGTGLAPQTDLVYNGPSISGAVVTAGASGSNWVNGHIAALEIETDQLHQWRLHGHEANGNASWAPPIDQAGIGLEIINPTPSSTVDNINVFKFGRDSILVDNHAASPGSGVFQLSDFFIGGSPHPIETRGSSTGLLLRFGGIDLGLASEFGMKFAGDLTGAAAVVESVKIEGDDDVPGVIVTGAAPVVFVGSTRYLNQSLYVTNPVNSAPSFFYSNPSHPQANVLQCLACTALGEKTVLALPDLSVAVPTGNKWGIDLAQLSTAGARAVTNALAAPETPISRPHAVVNLAPLCSAGNCDTAFASFAAWGGRYFLPAGIWTFSRPFTIPSGATLFGDGSQPGGQGGTELRYVGPATPQGAAVNFGPGGDLSGARLFSLRIDTQQSLSGGFGLRVINPTNATTVENVSIAGFPDGQLLVDNGSQNSGPGPNFFRIARFSLSGGVHPLEIAGGRQNLLIEQGTIALGPTSQDGVYLHDGENMAATRVVESVSVTGDLDVPGFRVDENAADVFINSSRSATGSSLESPGFLYSTTLPPRRLMECLRCSVTGLQTALGMPALGVKVPATDGQQFDFLNQSTPLQTVQTPFNIELPTVVGNPAVGQTLAAAPGTWTNGPTGYSYQWLRCLPRSSLHPGNYCTPISGAAQSTYTTTTTDRGQYLRVTVAATNPSGRETATSLTTALPVA
jgi:hypothetical protein